MGYGTLFPELVFNPENGCNSVDYTKLTAVLIEAVKELQSKNSELESRIVELENLR